MAYAIPHECGLRPPRALSGAAQRQGRATGCSAPAPACDTVRVSAVNEPPRVPSGRDSPRPCCARWRDIPRLAPPPGRAAAPSCASSRRRHPRRPQARRPGGPPRPRAACRRRPPQSRGSAPAPARQLVVTRAAPTVSCRDLRCALVSCGSSACACRLRLLGH